MHVNTVYTLKYLLLLLMMIINNSYLFVSLQAAAPHSGPTLTSTGEFVELHLHFLKFPKPTAGSREQRGDNQSQKKRGNKEELNDLNEKQSCLCYVIEYMHISSP